MQITDEWLKRVCDRQRIRYGDQTCYEFILSDDRKLHVMLGRGAWNVSISTNSGAGGPHECRSEVFLATMRKVETLCCLGSLLGLKRFDAVMD